VNCFCKIGVDKKRSFNVHYVEHKVQMPKTIKRKRY
jgi:aminoglycoside N3'-acetyltransferase